jgi:hypothetical protein
MDYEGAVAGTPLVSIFGGALFASVLLLPPGFRFLFLCTLAGFGILIGSNGTDLGLAGNGGS